MRMTVFSQLNYFTIIISLENSLNLLFSHINTLCCKCSRVISMSGYFSIKLKMATYKGLSISKIVCVCVCVSVRDILILTGLAGQWARSTRLALYLRDDEVLIVSL